MPNLFAITAHGCGPPACWASYCCLYECQIPASELGPRPACLNQSSICAIESTWSSCLPFGKAVSSCRYGRAKGVPWEVDKAVLDDSGLHVHPHDLVRLRLVTGDGVQAVGGQLLDQLGARGLVLDQHDARREGLALLAHRALQLGVFHAPAQHV